MRARRLGERFLVSYKAEAVLKETMFVCLVRVYSEAPKIKLRSKITDQSLYVGQGVTGK